MIRRQSVPSGFTILIITSLLSGSLVSACSEETKSDSAPLDVLDLQLRVHPGGARILTGRLVNRSSDPVSVAQIQVTLFDADNRPVSGMSVVLHDIPPGDEVSFREPVDSDLDVQGARVKNILVL